MPIFSTSMRYFEKVAREQSVRKAADFLHVAPSAVSRQILLLEEELDVALFERLPRGLRLTPAGELLLASMGQWQHERVRMLDALRGLTTGHTGRVRLAVPEALAYQAVPNAINRVRARLPRLRVETHVDLADAVMREVLEGKAEIGAAFNMPDAPQLRVEIVIRPRIGAIVAPGHPLATREQISLKECAPFQVILPEQEVLERSALRSFFEAIQDTHVVAATANRISAIASLARCGIGIAFLTRIDVGQELEAGTLVYVPLEDRIAGAPSLSLFVAKKARVSAPAALMLEALRAGLEELA